MFVNHQAILVTVITFSFPPKIRSHFVEESSSPCLARKTESDLLFTLLVHLLSIGAGWMEKLLELLFKVRRHDLTKCRDDQ